MKQDIRKKIGRLSFLLLTLYIIIVIYFVLFSDRLGRTDAYNSYRYNLTLFNEIRRFIRYRDQVSPGAFFLNLLGNLMVLFPFGFLIPILRLKKTTVWRIVIYAFLFSFGIELLQLITRVGVFDVDDIFLNVLGAVLGFEIYHTLLFLYYYIRMGKE